MKKKKSSGSPEDKLPVFIQKITQHNNMCKNVPFSRCTGPTG